MSQLAPAPDPVVIGGNISLAPEPVPLGSEVSSPVEIGPVAPGLRVLHCIHSLYGGGAERQLKLIAADSHRVGIQSAIFCVNPDVTEQFQIPIFQARTSSKFDLSIYGALRQAIRAFQPDIIHAWLPASITIPAMIAARHSGIPCVYSYRNAMRFHRPLSYLEYLVAAACCQRIVSNNPIAQSIAAYRALYRIKDGRTIPNAVQVPADFRKSVPVPPTGEAAQLLFVGRLTRQKNIDCLLRALALLPPDLNWHQTICGTGEEEESLQQLVGQLGLTRKVTFSGYRHDIYALMQMSDLLILPSWWEGMPNVLLESLAIGLPCIASDIPANRALLADDCCTFFDPASAPDLAGAITSLLGNRERLDHQVAMGLHLAQNHSVDNLLDKYADFYRSLASVPPDTCIPAAGRSVS